QLWPRIRRRIRLRRRVWRRVRRIWRIPTRRRRAILRLRLSRLWIWRGIRRQRLRRQSRAYTDLRIPRRIFVRLLVLVDDHGRCPSARADAAAARADGASPFLEVITAEQVIKEKNHKGSAGGDAEPGGADRRNQGLPLREE